MNVFTPTRDFESALAQGKSDVESWQRTGGPRNYSKWAEWAGDELPGMMRDRELTVRSLGSPNVRIRLTAACLLANYWPAYEWVAPHALRLAFEDPEPSVRGAGLLALWMVRQHVSDPTGFLAKLIAELFPGPPADVKAEILRGMRERKRLRIAVIGGRWQVMAGIHVAPMGESRAAAESYLSHPDPLLRRAALLAIKYHWTPDEAFKRHCERLIFEDQDVEVRSLALTCLAGCYFQSDDARIGRLAARMVHDDSSPRDLRVAAYRALFSIRGMPSEWLLKTVRPGFRFPEDVDWEFVETFHQERS